MDIVLVLWRKLSRLTLIFFSLSLFTQYPPFSQRRARLRLLKEESSRRAVDEIVDSEQSQTPEGEVVDDAASASSEG